MTAKGWMRWLRIVMLAALVLPAVILPAPKAVRAATYTENFDIAGNWTCAGGNCGAYDSHTYANAIYPAVQFSSSLAVRETVGIQDSYPRTHGDSTYAWRLRDAVGSSWQAKITTGGVGTFSVWVRRWDSSPDPNYLIEYSVNNGSSWTTVQTINNTWLGSSDWKQASGTINTSNGAGESDDIIIRIRRTGGERLMVDDFEMTDYAVDTAPTVTSTSPETDATSVAIDANISVTFSEAVNVGNGWYTISCNSSGTHTAAVTGGPTTFTLDPDTDFVHSETCTVTIDKDLVADQDGTPDNMTADYSWNFATIPVCAGLFFSEYVEGSSNNKALEIYNGTANAVDLSAYSVELYSNGSSSPGNLVALTGTLNSGDVYIIANSSAVAAILEIADLTSAVTNFNGDDALVLKHNGAIIDVIGQIGTDPGTEWGTDLTSTLDNTLRRKDMVSAGDSNGSDAFDPSIEWDGYAIDTFNGLGSHSAHCAIDIPPTVSSTTPASNATYVATNTTITVNFSESVDVAAGVFTVACPTGSPVTFSSAPALPANDTNSVVLTPSGNLPEGTLCTVTVDASKVTDNDGTPNAMTTNYSWSFTTTDSSVITKIHAIQGSGSAVTPGTFTVEAIVVGDFQGVIGTNDDKLDGFFIQEEDADADTNPTTSEGIFVYCGTCPTNVVVGDKVQVTGASAEYYNMSQLNATTAGAITVLSSGNTLPTPAAVTLPVPGVTATDLVGAQAQINAYFESFEGMLVTVPESLSVTEYFELSRYGQIVLAQGGRFRQFTDATSPSGAGYTAHLIDMAKRTIILDDDSNQQNHAIAQDPDIPVFHPTPGGFSITNYVRGGDTISNLTGVLHWSFAGQSGTDAWRIRPVTGAFSYAFTAGNPRSAPADVGGNIKVASFNVLNYFTTLNSRGAHSAAELDRQAAKIVAALMGLDADVIGVMEIENNNDVAIADLVSRLNAVAGAGTYAYIATGSVGTDQITVGIIYKPAKVTPVGAVQTLTAAAFTDPNVTGTQKNRPAVAQTFQENIWGERFTVVVNHLKSKGSCPSSGLDADQNNGQGCWNDTRQKGTTYLVNTWLPTLSASTGDPDFLIIGDLNAYRKEDPISNIKSAGYTDLLDAKLGAPAYGYVFDGQLGYLDHALGSASLTLRVSGITQWHINGDEVNLLDYNDTVKDTGEADFDVKPAATTLYEANAYRSSDHDPVLVGLNMLPNQSNLETYAMAWHTGSGTLRLGDSWQPGPSADDNDGVTFGVFQAGQQAQVTVNVQGTATSGRWLRLWFDWNKNGVFDSDERVINQAVNDGNNALNVSVPAGISTAIPYRARLYDAASMSGMGILEEDLGASGGATGGEVEDGSSPVPTAVFLTSFAAVPQGENILLIWETAAELQNLGFNLYRAENAAGPWVKLNATLIPAQNPGATFGASYEWLDIGVIPDTTYFYRLEDVDVNGASTFHGPVSATAAGVAAVSIAAFSARSPFMGLALAFAAAAVLVGWRRRR